MTPIERMQAEIEKQGISIAEFSRRLRIDRPERVFNWIRRESLPKSMLLPVAEVLGVSVEWLMTGNEQKGTIEQAPPLSRTKQIGIPICSASPSAGGGAEVGFEEMEGEILVSNEWIDKLIPVRTGSLFALRPRGDSMEPTFSSGDILFVDRYITPVDYPPEDGIYVFLADGNLFVKRLQIIPGGQLRAISDNNLYPPFDIPITTFTLLGRVCYVWNGRAA